MDGCSTQLMDQVCENLLLPITHFMASHVLSYIAQHSETYNVYRAKHTAASLDTATSILPPPSIPWQACWRFPRYHDKHAVASINAVTACCRLPRCCDNHLPQCCDKHAAASPDAVTSMLLPPSMLWRPDCFLFSCSEWLYFCAWRTWFVVGVHGYLRSTNLYM